MATARLRLRARRPSRSVRGLDLNFDSSSFGLRVASTHENVARTVGTISRQPLRMLILKSSIELGSLHGHMPVKDLAEHSLRQNHVAAELSAVVGSAPVQPTEYYVGVRRFPDVSRDVNVSERDPKSSR